MSKNIDDCSDAVGVHKEVKIDDTKPQWREINLDNVEAIKFWLESGWVGVDIKNLADAKDNDPKNWVLIMEKKADVEDLKTGD